MTNQIKVEGSILQFQQYNESIFVISTDGTRVRELLDDLRAG
jgi:hypothetical protein